MDESLILLAVPVSKSSINQPIGLGRNHVIMLLHQQHEELPLMSR